MAYLAAGIFWDDDLRAQVNTAGANYWHTYTAEICDQLGLTVARVKRRQLRAEDLAELTVLFLPDLDGKYLTAAEKAALGTWVEHGGLLIGFATQGLGDLFVVRVGGNIVNAENLASIEYAVEHLKAPLIVVLGHTHCGAVKAAVDGQSLEGHLPHLVRHIEPVIRQLRHTHPHLKGDALIERVTQENVRYTIRVILERSEIVRKQYEAGKVQFAGGVYHLREGKVEWLKLPEGIEGDAHAEKSAKEASHSGH